MKIVNPGMQSSFQDLGREGFMHQGVSRSGAMDTESIQFANWLVGNPSSHVALEVTLIGPTIEFEEDLQIAICGADFEMTLNECTINRGETITIKCGDILSFGKLISGARAYIAFSGNPELERQLGSFSTHLTANFGGYQGRALRKNDQIHFTPYQSIQRRELPKELVRTYSGNYLIRCCESVESDLFVQHKEEFYNSKFSISPESNRMGIRLKGRPLNLGKIESILSCGLTVGSIQIPNSGLPIISAVDGQTIGGYPRIANVATCDLPLLGQLKAGDKLQFYSISIEEARAISRNKNLLVSKRTS